MRAFSALRLLGWVQEQAMEFESSNALRGKRWMRTDFIQNALEQALVELASLQWVA